MATIFYVREKGGIMSIS